MPQPNLTDFDPFSLPSSVATPAPAPRPRLAPMPTRTPASVVPMPQQPQPRQSGAKAPAGREMPWSEEAERHVIACCLIDGSDTIVRATEERITADSFYSPANRLLWETIVDLHGKTPPVTLEMLAEELRTRRTLDAIGGFPYLMQVSGHIPTTAHAGYFIKKVREKERLRNFIKAATGVVEQCYGFTGGMNEFTAEIETQWAGLLHDVESSSLPEVKPITAFNYPAASDPNILLGSDDYLGRGGGMLFVSHGGAGKSSLVMDAAMTWALGEPFMGIRANGKLRFLIIQAEDSDRYVGKVAESFIFKRQLDEEQVATIRENVVTVRVRGVTGQAFFRLVRKLVDEHLPDIVIVNPVYLYAEGDISRPEFAQPFLVGLDAVNKDERFAWLLVHHTGKPAKKQGGKPNAELQDWETTYMGFGSSYFANWPRCSMLLEPKDGKPGRFNLRLGKAGVNAGVTARTMTANGESYEPTTKIPIRHCSDRMKVGGKDRPCIYWEYDNDADESMPDSSEPSESKQNKRKRAAGGGKYSLSEVLALFPTEEDKAESLRVILKKANDILAMPRSTLMEYRAELIADGMIAKTDVGGYYRPTYQP